MVIEPESISLRGAVAIITSAGSGMGRMGRPEEIAELVRFLCGPESSYCTGDIFTASGGYN